MFRDYKTDLIAFVVEIHGEHSAVANTDLDPPGEPQKEGEHVVVIGSPKGLTNTVSDGIIANLHRIVDGMDLIQITAPISHGSSGSPVFNDSSSGASLLDPSARARAAPVASEF